MAIINTGPRVGLLHKRVDAVEQVANAALQAAKAAHALAESKQQCGRDGAPGGRGESITGPKGDRGPAGADSQVPGPAGQSITGAPGKDGRDGRDAPDVSEILAEAKRDMAKVHQEYREIKLMLQGILDINKKAGDYIEWLKQRNEARWSARKK